MSIQRTRLELVAVRGPLGGARLPLRLGENVVGRDDWVDLPVVSSAVSRRHAVVRVRAGGHVVVQDLASRNGTRLNGMRVDDEMLVNLGDVIEVGDVALQLVEVRPEVADGGPPTHGANGTWAGAGAVRSGPAGHRPGPDARLPGSETRRPGQDPGQPPGRPAAPGVPSRGVPSIEHSTPTGLIPRVPPLPGPGTGVGERFFDPLPPGPGPSWQDRDAAGGARAQPGQRQSQGRRSGPGAGSVEGPGASRYAGADPGQDADRGWGTGTGASASPGAGRAAGGPDGGPRRGTGADVPGWTPRAAAAARRLPSGRDRGARAAGRSGRSGAVGTAVLHLLALLAVLGAVAVAVTSDGRVRGLALALVVLAGLVVVRRVVVRRVRR